MKIPNPWPWHPLSRCICRTEKGDVVCVGSTREPELEVPDAEEVLIEPVKYAPGHVDTIPIGQGRIWSKRWGLLDIEDHLKKQQIEAEEAELKLKQRKQQKRDEKPARVVSEKIEATLDMGSTLEL